MKIMKLIVLALCAITAAAGVLGIVFPARLADLIVLIQEPAGLYGAAGMRLLFGGALLVVASGSRAPITLRVIGWILVFTGIIMPLPGVEYIEERLRWYFALGPWFLRVWGGVAIMFGGLLAYAVIPRFTDS
jgi:hypothetical protein